MSLQKGKGALKLKGDDGIKKKKKKKSKDKDKDTELALVGGTSDSGVKETAEGYVLPPKPADADHRTEAEKKYDALMEEREAQRVAKMISKTHRQRVAEFNEHLGSLTEHMDIPKVGPG